MHGAENNLKFLPPWWFLRTSDLTLATKEIKYVSQKRWKVYQKNGKLLGGKGVIELRNPLNNPDPTCGFLKASQWDQLCGFALKDKISIHFRQIIFPFLLWRGGALQRKRTC